MGWVTRLECLLSPAVHPCGHTHTHAHLFFYGGILNICLYVWLCQSHLSEFRVRWRRCTGTVLLIFMHQWHVLIALSVDSVKRFWNTFLTSTTWIPLLIPQEYSNSLLITTETECARHLSFPLGDASSVFISLCPIFLAQMQTPPYLSPHQTLNPGYLPVYCRFHICCLSL